MALLVRSWNLFHGNASPPRRRSYLWEMVVLASADRPDVLCVQEVPIWGLEHLGAWSGMRVFPAIARQGVPPARLSGWVTRQHNGLLRSAVTGQANAILVGSGHDVEDLGAERVSGRGRERRVCQAVRLDGSIVVANTHLSSGRNAQPAELDRVHAFAESRARPGDVVVLAGDLNLRDPRVVGYSAAGAGIDHVLVRGATAGPLVVWSHDRRRQNGVVLSDHAPVELTIG